MKVIYKLLSTMQHLMYIFIQAGLPIGKRCFFPFQKRNKEKSTTSTCLSTSQPDSGFFMLQLCTRSDKQSANLCCCQISCIHNSNRNRRKGGRYNSSEHVTIAQEAFLRLPSLLFGMSQPSELLHQLVASANGVLLITQNYFPVAKMLYNFHIFVLR